MIYVTHDQSGNLTGLYRQEIHASHVGASIVVDESIAKNWTAYQANAERDGVELAPVIVPPVPVPQVVSKFQAKAALLNAGYLASVEAIMSNPATPELSRLAWTEAQEFLRTSPTVAGMAAALSLTDTQVDDLFRYAATVTA